MDRDLSVRGKGGLAQHQVRPRKEKGPRFWKGRGWALDGAEGGKKKRPPAGRGGNSTDFSGQGKKGGALCPKRKKKEGDFKLEGIGEKKAFSQPVGRGGVCRQKRGKEPQADIDLGSSRAEQLNDYSKENSDGTYTYTRRRERESKRASASSQKQQREGRVTNSFAVRGRLGRGRG